MDSTGIINIIKEIQENGINKDCAYNILTCYGFSEKEGNTIYPDHSLEWQQYFSNINNISCEPDIAFGFCCFRNGNLARNTINQIKIYIPLDKKNLEEGVIRIFRFLADNNIMHSSKVRKQILRNDNIVVRVGKKEDAIKLINFIKQDEYLQESKISANPFTTTDEKIGLVCDGLYSYNSVTTNMINLYLQSSTEEIEYTSFKKWLNNWYKETFTDGSQEKLKELKRISTHNSVSDVDNETKEAILNVNLKQIIELLILNISGKANPKKFYQFYEEITNENNYRQEINQMKEYLRQNQIINNINPKEETIEPLPLQPKIEIPFTYEEYVQMEEAAEEEKLLNELKQINIVRNDKEFTYNFLSPKEKLKALKEKEKNIRYELEEIYNYNKELNEIKEEIIFEIMNFSDEQEITKKLEEEGMIIQKQIELQKELEQVLNSIKNNEEKLKKEEQDSQIEKEMLKEAKRFFKYFNDKNYDIEGLTEEEKIDLYHFFKTNPLGKDTYEKTIRKMQNETLENYFQKTR